MREWRVFKFCSALWSRFRAWCSSVRNRFWRWLFKVSGEHLGIHDRTQVLDQDWWRVVRHRMQELSNSDLGRPFVQYLFAMEDEDKAIDDQGREYRDYVRDIRDPR